LRRDFLGMFPRLVRAIDFLTSQPEWDGCVVIVFGSSQWGAQVIVAAGLDPRVTFFAAGIPAMCDHIGILAGRVNGWPKFVPTAPTASPARRSSMPSATTTLGISPAGPKPLEWWPWASSTPPALPAACMQIINQPLSPHQVTPVANDAMRLAIQARIEAMKNQN
jgi:hypothetical protein